jgi:hypothetical protein
MFGYLPPTPRGPVQVARQQMRGLRGERGWKWFWLHAAPPAATGRTPATAREAIRRATLLPTSAAPRWLAEAAASAQAQLLAGNGPAGLPAAADDKSP